MDWLLVVLCIGFMIAALFALYRYVSMQKAYKDMIMRLRVEIMRKAAEQVFKIEANGEQPDYGKFMLMGNTLGYGLKATDRFRQDAALKACDDLDEIEDGIGVEE